MRVLVKFVGVIPWACRCLLHTDELLFVTSFDRRLHLEKGESPSCPPRHQQRLSKSRQVKAFLVILPEAPLCRPRKEWTKKWAEHRTQS